MSPKAAELTLAEIPGEDATWREVVDFALAFDVYGHWGSTEAVDEALDAMYAAHKDATTLNILELRTCLFAAQRATRIVGVDTNTEVNVRELVRLLREKVAFEENQPRRSMWERL